MDNEKLVKIHVTRNAKFNMGNYESQDVMVSLTITTDEKDDDNIKKELMRVTSMVENHLADIMADNGLEFIANLRDE